jgi:hypothetical protein
VGRVKKYTQKCMKKISTWAARIYANISMSHNKNPNICKGKAGGVQPQTGCKKKTKL